jgi:hypothetical protein
MDAFVGMIQTMKNFREEGMADHERKQKAEQIISQMMNLFPSDEEDTM